MCFLEYNSGSVHSFLVVKSSAWGKKRKTLKIRKGDFDLILPYLTVFHFLFKSHGPYLTKC